MSFRYIFFILYYPITHNKIITPKKYFIIDLWEKISVTHSIKSDLTETHFPVEICGNAMMLTVDLITFTTNLKIIDKFTVKLLED